MAARTPLTVAKALRRRLGDAGAADAAGGSLLDGVIRCLERAATPEDMAEVLLDLCVRLDNESGALRERAKELRCLQQVGAAALDSQEPAGLLAAVVPVIGEAMLHPGRAVALVEMGGFSAGHVVGGNLLESPIVADGARLGRVAVSYPDQCAFLKEEGLLLAQIAAILGTWFAKWLAAKELATTKTKMATVLCSIGDAMIATDAEGRVTMMNPVAERLTGWPLDKAAGRPLPEVFHIIDTNTRAELPNPVERVLATGGIVGLANHTSLIARDGTEYQIADSAAPIHDPDGGISGVVLVFHDVSDSYAKQRKIEESEAFLKSAVNALNHAFQVIDAEDFTILMANAAGGGKAAVGRKCHQVSHASDTPCSGDEHPCALRGVVATGKPMIVEHRHYNEAGEPVDVEVHAHPIFDSDGRVSRIIEYSMDITERRRMMEEQRLQKEMLERIFEATPYTMMLMDADCRVERLNRPGDNFVGIDGDCAGAPCGKLLNCVNAIGEPGCGGREECKACSLRSLAEWTLKTGESFHDREGTLIRKINGGEEQVDVLVSTSLLHTGRGERVLVTIADITARKRAERQLRDSEERFRCLFETIADAIFIADSGTGMIVEANAAASRLVGRSIEELRSMHQAQLHPPQVEAEARRAFQEFTNAHGEIFLMETEVRHADGHDIPVEISSGGHFDTNGRPCNVGIFRDISERLRQRREIEVSREQFVLAVRGSNDGIWDWDIRSNRLFLSAKWKEMLGYQDDEMLNEFASFEKNLHPDDKPRVMAYVSEYLKGGQEQYEHEFRMRHKDGSYRWILARGQAIPDEQGVPYRMAGSHTDITERKRADEQLRLAKDELERANEDLRLQTAVANELMVRAEVANEAKSQFLANMSHEIRTPMNGVIGMTELLLDSNLSDEQREFAELLGQSGEHMMNVINDILDFSKIEAGKLDIRPVPMNIREVVEGVLAPIKIRARDKGLGFTTKVDGEVSGNLLGDPFRIGQIIMNLAGNAVKFTDTGMISVEVTVVAPLKADMVVLRFNVADTGIGIPAEQVEKLFQPFVQADGSCTRMYGGTGLGLTISRQLVEMMGGEIGVDSAEGQGSKFWFTLALELAGEQAATSRRPAESAPEFAGAARGVRVLVVEDNQVNLRLATSVVERMGAEAETARDGREAIEKLKAGEYDLVLMDCQMPVMDGFEAVRAIRAGAAGAEKSTIPVVAMTANAMEGDRDQCLVAGMDDYLPKPVKINTIAAMIAKWTKKSGQQ